MTLEAKDLLEASIALSVYISAVRLYAESRLSNPIEKDEDTLKVLIFLVTLPDMFFVATVFLLLGFLHSIGHGFGYRIFYSISVLFYWSRFTSLNGGEIFIELRPCPISAKQS